MIFRTAVEHAKKHPGVSKNDLFTALKSLLEDKQHFSLNVFFLMRKKNLFFYLEHFFLQF